MLIFPKRTSLTGFCLVLLLLLAMNRPNVQADSAAPISAHLPLSFMPNVGQSQPEVSYQVRGLGGTLAFTRSEVLLALPLPPTETPADNSVPYQQSDSPTASTILRLQFVDANPAPEISSSNVLPGKVNTFIGSDPSQWHTGIPTYGSITYTNLYPGVDLHYDGKEGLLKGSYIVAPHTDPSIVRWRYAGADHVAVDVTSGDLHIALLGGSVLAEQAPLAWQHINGQDVPVSIAYQLTDDGSIGFKLGDYDADYALTLDPTLAYSTYLGGSQGDTSRDIALDSSGNIYIVGDTLSNDFPTATPLHPILTAKDVFIAKLSPDGSQLLYATYLGGADREDGYGIAVDGAGNAYVVGNTQSADFPIVGAYQSTYNTSALRDGFIAKLNPDGSALLYSTYLGGSDDDIALKIAVDSASKMYVTGITVSTDFPTANAAQNSIIGIGWDIFVTALQANGTSLIYSTYLGGDRIDLLGDIAIDSGSNVYIGGYTDSLNFTVVNALQPTDGKANCPIGDITCKDAIFAKFTPTGNLAYSSYFGGSDNDEASGIAIDSSGNVYLTGVTWSTDFPLLNAYQTSNAGHPGAFVAKINAAGSTLLYSTYLGGGVDAGGGIAVDITGSTYIAGTTRSSSFPMVEAFQSTKTGSNITTDLYIARFSPAGSSLLFSSYLGGSDVDGDFYAPGRIALDNAGNVYIASGTASTDFPTVAAYQNTINGTGDAFIARVNISLLVVNNASDIDDGTCSPTNCSLREAINAANAAPDATTIAFNIPGAGVHTIQPNVMYPAITSPVIIDGTTQPGYSGAPLIELDGSLIPAAIPANGLWIQGGNSTVKGLIINRFTFGGITLENGGNNTIIDNYIGIDNTGTQARGNRDGVYIYNSTNNVVGGITAADRNIISGNNDDGVNFAGTTGGDSNTVQGNYIGTDVTGTQPIGNHGDGVKISEESDNNLIGGTTAAAANRIAYNLGRGVYAENVSAFSTGNRIWGNQIYGDIQLGIDLKGDGITANDAGDADTGPNNLQNFPLLTGAVSEPTDIVLTGILNSTPNTTFRLEFFANPACDSSGNGEGQTFLGFSNVNTNGSGNAVINVTLPTFVADGQFITATATDPGNNTSEFSACVAAMASSPADATPSRNIFTTHKPTLTWAAVTWATGYEIQVDNNQDFGSNEFHPAVLPASPLYKTTDDLPNGLYYWHVRAIDANNKPGAWSTTDSFVVNAP